MKLKALIIDDEQHCIDTLSYDLEKHCGNKVVLAGSAMNAVEAVTQLHQLKPDVVFMDIELPGMTGIQLLQSIGKLESALVFTTAYSQYAIEGYKYEAAAYLLKPVDKDELIAVIDRLSEQHTPAALSDRLSITDSKGIELIDFAAIRYCEASNNYCIIHLKNGGQKVVSKTLKAIESQLPTEGFVRIHQSYLVNMGCVTKYLKEDGGLVQLDNGSTLRLSKGYKEGFLALLK